MYFFTLPLFLGMAANGHGYEVRLLETPGKSLEARIESIASANREIYVETFYLENDRTGNGIVIELMKKKLSAPEIDIKLILDGYGSASYPAGKLCALKDLDISIHIFSPVKISDPITSQRRDHRKIWYTDERTILGGRNLSDENFSQNKWDMDIELKNASENAARVAFLKMWGRSVEVNCDKVIRLPIEAENLTKSFELQNSTWHKADLEMVMDYGKKEKETYQKFLADISSARDSLYLETGHYTPNKKMLEVLKQKSAESVNIKLMINSPAMGYWMSSVTTCASLKYQSDLMMERNISFFNPKKSITTHSKLALIDDRIFSLGSFNMHEKSISWNAETWITIKNFDDEMLAEIKTFIAQRLANSQKIQQLKERYKEGEFTKAEYLKCSALKNIAPILRAFI